MLAITVNTLEDRGGAARWDRFGVSSQRTGRIDAAMCRPPVGQRAQGARWVGLFAAGGDVAVAAAVPTLGELVSREDSFNVTRPRKEFDRRPKGINVSRGHGYNHRARTFSLPNCKVGLEEAGGKDRDPGCISDRVRKRGEEKLLGGGHEVVW